MKNCLQLWLEAHVQVKLYKTHHARANFGKLEVEKVHAVVTRFPDQNAQSPPFADPFWTFGRRASACRCGEKHISKPKSTKQTRSGNGSDGMSGNVPPCRSNCCSVLFVNWFRFSTNRGIAERIAAIYAFSLCLCRKLTWLRPLHPCPPGSRPNHLELPPCLCSS